MSIAVLFSEIAERQQARAKNYRALVAQITDNLSVDPAQAESVLSISGKSLDQLQADVTALRERQRLAQVIADAAPLEQERAALQAERARLAQAFKDAETAYHAGIGPIDSRELQIVQASSEARAAAARLRESASPELKARQTALHADMEAIAAKRKATVKQAEEQRGLAGVARSRLDSIDGKHPSRPGLDRDLQQATDRAAKFAAAVEEFDRQLKDMEEQGAKIAQEMLLP